MRKIVDFYVKTSLTVGYSVFLTNLIIRPSHDIIFSFKEGVKSSFIWPTYTPQVIDNIKRFKL